MQMLLPVPYANTGTKRPLHIQYRHIYVRPTHPQTAALPEQRPPTGTCLQPHTQSTQSPAKGTEDAVGEVKRLAGGGRISSKKPLYCKCRV